MAVGIQKTSFEVPYKESIQKEGVLSQSWTWFFREVWERLTSLGKELSTKIENGVEAKAFASATDINVSTDIITETAHLYTTGLKGWMSTDNALPSPLQTLTNYYIIKVDADTYKLATTEANAIAGTAINILNTGTGNQTFTPHLLLNNLKLNKSYVSHAIVDFLIQRVTTSTGATELIEHITYAFVYKPTSLSWEKVAIVDNLPDNSGVDIFVLSDGSVYYNATLITGTASISKIHYRSRTMGGKSTVFSSQGGR
jgi:hypothetical protein